MKFDNNTHKPNSYDEEEDMMMLTQLGNLILTIQDENKKRDGVKEDDYDTKYDDDEYEVETERTDNENNGPQYCENKL